MISDRFSLLVGLPVHVLTNEWKTRKKYIITANNEEGVTTLDLTQTLRKGIVFAVCFSVLLMLAGCNKQGTSMNNGNANMRSQQVTPNNVRPNNVIPNRVTPNNVGPNQNQTAPNGTAPNGVNPQNRMNTMNSKDMTVASKAADKITSLPEVQRATVIVSGGTAYVAAQLNGKAKMSQAVEKKIADCVRAKDKTIGPVYVSTNMDFVNRMRTYANDLQNGKPVTGLFNQFSDMVQRVFPNAH